MAKIGSAWVSRWSARGVSFNPALTSVPIDSVKPVSPAATAGLQVGDAIGAAKPREVAPVAARRP